MSMAYAMEPNSADIPEVNLKAELGLQLYEASLVCKCKAWIRADFDDIAEVETDMAKVKSLIEKRANVNANINGNTALRWAVVCNNEELAKLLLEAGADANMEHVLNLAANNGRESLCRLLIDHGANVNLQKQDASYNSIAYTPLHSACMMGNRRGDFPSYLTPASYEQIVKLLLDNRAEANIEDAYGWDPLMEAASRGYLRICEILIQDCPYLSLKQPFGQAVCAQRFDVCKLFIDAVFSQTEKEQKDAAIVFYGTLKNRLGVGRDIATLVTRNLVDLQIVNRANRASILSTIDRCTDDAFTKQLSEYIIQKG